MLGEAVPEGNEMKTAVWLWIAAVIALLFAAGHTVGHPWTPVQGLGPEAVVAAMREVHFQVEGINRSYLDFYQGFGWTLSALLFMVAALLARQAALATINRPVDRVLIAIEALGFLLSGVAAAVFIAPMPAAFNAAVTVALLGALLSSRRRS